MAKTFNSGTWAVVGIVAAGLVLGLAALAVRPPPPKELPAGKPTTAPAGDATRFAR